MVCRYLVHMVQLDAAAMNLKRRFEDPNITASLEAQQAYTRALAPGGDRCFIAALFERYACALHHPAIFRHEICGIYRSALAPFARAVLGLSGVQMRPKQGRCCRRRFHRWQSHGHPGPAPPHELPACRAIIHARVCNAGQELVQAPPQMTVLASQAMPYPLTFQPQPGAAPGQLMPSTDYADLGEASPCHTQEHPAENQHGW